MNYRALYSQSNVKKMSEADPDISIRGVVFFFIENKIWFPNNKKLVLRKIKRNRYIVQTTYRIYIFKSRNNPMSKTIDFFFK
jgi:hypothetical protein